MYFSSPVHAWGPVLTNQLGSPPHQREFFIYVTVHTKLTVSPSSLVCVTAMCIDYFSRTVLSCKSDCTACIHSDISQTIMYLPWALRVCAARHWCPSQRVSPVNNQDLITKPIFSCMNRSLISTCIGKWLYHVYHLGKRLYLCKSCSFVFVRGIKDNIWNRVITLIYFPLNHRCFGFW